MKTKRIVFLIICSIAILLIASPYIKSFFLESKQKDEILLKAGEYEIGKDISGGIYDIEAQDDLILQGKSFYEGGISKAVLFQEGEFINVENGSLLITKAMIDKLDLINNEEYVVKHSGFYYVGEQLETGKYILTYSTREFGTPFIQTINDEREVIQTFDLDENKDINIELDENMILQIEKTLFEEVKDLDITLKKING